MSLAEFRVSVKVKAPCDEVWQQLVDWKSQSEWMALTKVHSSADGDGLSGVGTEIHAFTGIGKFGLWDHMRVTHWEPPQFCAVDHYGHWIKGIGEFRLVALTDSQTRFDWYEKINAPAALLALIKPGILIAVYISLRKFSRKVSARKPNSQ
jgi:hypothetical protein